MTEDDAPKRDQNTTNTTGVLKKTEKCDIASCQPLCERTERGRE